MSISTIPRTPALLEIPDDAYRVASKRGEGGTARERTAPPAGALAGVISVAALLLVLVVVHLAGLSLVRLASGSMSPGYPTDSVLLVRDVAASEVRVGDIVTVSRDGRIPITHRVVDARPAPGDATALVLKGDANSVEDPEPYRVARVGLVVAGVPFGGSVLTALQSPLGLGVTTVFVALLVLWAWWPRRTPGAHAREREHGRRTVGRTIPTPDGAVR